MPATHILLAAGAGVTAAILFASWLSGSFWALSFAYLASLPLFAAGLALGIGAAAIAGIAGTVGVLAAGGVALGLAFGAINAAPAFILSRQALLNRPAKDGGTEWYPPGRLVMWLAAIAAIMFVGILLALSGAQDGLEGFMRLSLAEVLKTISPPETPSSAIDQIAGALARYMPGLSAITWIQMIAVNGILAQSLLVLCRRNRRPSPRMTDIEFPSWLLVGTAIAAIGAFMPGLSGFIGSNLVLIALGAFFFAGLAVIHTLAGARSSRSFWLFLVYTITIVFTWPAVLIAALGVVETWVGLRRRFAGHPPRT